MEILYDTIKIDTKNTKIIAHRGLSGIETENTNAAFVAGVRLHMPGDKKVCCFHTDSLLYHIFQCIMWIPFAPIQRVPHGSLGFVFLDDLLDLFEISRR